MINFIKYKVHYTKYKRYTIITNQTIVATITCGVFFRGARIGSPNNPLHSIPLAKQTNIVESQHDKGCLRENACAPESNICYICYYIIF